MEEDRSVRVTTVMALYKNKTKNWKGMFLAKSKRLGLWFL